MAEQLIDFQSALSELQMSEEELSNLVARGDLRVIRSGGKPMFDSSDINNIRQNRETEPFTHHLNSILPRAFSQLTLCFQFTELRRIIGIRD